MRIVALAMLFAIGSTTPAWAYLDPGTGSIILQGLIAGLASALFIFKSYFYRLKNLFRRGEGDKQAEAERD